MAMTLEQWKAKYPDAQSFYDGFHDSDEGLRSWELAYSYMAVEYDEDDEDQVPPVDNAQGEVLSSMEDWVMEEFEDASDEEYAKAQDWFDSMMNSLGEMIYAGLT